MKICTKFIEKLYQFFLYDTLWFLYDPRGTHYDLPVTPPCQMPMTHLWPLYGLFVLPVTHITPFEPLVTPMTPFYQI